MCVQKEPKYGQGEPGFPLCKPLCRLAALATDLDFSGKKNLNPYCAQMRSKGSRGRICPHRLAVLEKIFALLACSIFSTAAGTPPRCIRHWRRSAPHPLPLPRCGEGAVWASNCLFYPQSRQRDFLRLACRNRIKNQPYKRRRVGRNLRLSRADPALCSGQPSPLRCILLSPQGLTTLRGPRLYGAYRRVGSLGRSPE